MGAFFRTFLTVGGLPLTLGLCGLGLVLLVVGQFGDLAWFQFEALVLLVWIQGRIAWMRRP